MAESDFPLRNILAPIFPKRRAYPDNGQNDPDREILDLDLSVGDYIRAVGVAERRDVFQKFRAFGEVRDDIQKIKRRRKSKS